MTTDAQTEARAIAPWHLGSMNDGLFIIDTPPRPSVDDAWHDQPDGPAVALNVTDLPIAKAQAIVDAHNAALAAKDAELAECIPQDEHDRLRADYEQVCVALNESNVQLAEANKAPDLDALASTVANIRQGESETPRCEPPGAYDVGIAREWVSRVLKAIDLLRAARRAREAQGGK